LTVKAPTPLRYSPSFHMHIKLGQLDIYIGLSFAVVFALGAFFSDMRIYLISLLSALFHETVHLIALYFSGCKTAALNFSFGGVKLICPGFSYLSFDKTVFCTLSAPLGNIFAGALFYCLYALGGKNIFFEISAVNIFLGAVNLLPLPFLDGGRALFSFLGKRSDILTARKISSFVGICSLVFLFLVFFLLFLSGKYYLFFLIFFIYCVIGCLGDKDSVFT